MKANIYLGVIILILFLGFSTAFPHSGRTNSEGCHKNRKTGDYHCHNSGSRTKTTKRIIAYAAADISKGIICTHDAYNCPSYKGKYQSKRLKDCKDVKMVWEKCGKRDIHGLDDDNDGWPCEKKCKPLLRKGNK